MNVDMRDKSDRILLKMQERIENATSPLRSFYVPLSNAREKELKKLIEKLNTRKDNTISI